MDDVMNLFEELARSGVQLSELDGQLKVTAAKGVLTQGLKQRIAENKRDLLEALQGSSNKSVSPTVTILQSRSDEDHLPFPLSDLQLGFYVAGDPYMEFHVRPHCYMELDRTNLDVRRYEQAWNDALAHHRRELCKVNSDAQLELLIDLPRIRIAVNDLTALAPPQAQEALLATRAKMERKELPLDCWPWFEICVSQWTENSQTRWRIHYNHNNFFIDGYGSTILLLEIEQRYTDPSFKTAQVAISYREAVLGLEALAETEEGRAAKSYWMNRLESLPPPPAVPLRAQPNRRCRSKLERRERFLTRTTWESLKAHAAAHGITPSNALTTAYATVLSAYSNSDHFILSEMVTRRTPELHPDMMRMLGNFVSLYPLEVKLDADASFAENASRIQRQVLQDMKHLQFGGMRVMQALNRQKGGFGDAPSPFVVGSGLFLKKWGMADYTVLETSQTLLDHQFFELGDGRLHWVWDLLEEFFPVGLKNCGSKQSMSFR